MKRRSEAPPLGVWGIVIMIVTICIFLLFQLPLKDPFYPHNEEYLEFKARLANFNKSFHPDPEERIVLCWGTSLSSQAINHTPVLKKHLQEISNQKIGIYKMYMHGCTAEVLHYMDGLFSATNTINPDLLVIEDQLLLFAPASSLRSNLVLKYKKRVEDLFHKKENLVVPSYVSNMIFDEIDDRLRSNIQFDSTLSIDPIQRYIYRFDPKYPLEEKLNIFKKNGTPIIILNIPRVGPVEKSMDMRSDTTRVREYVEKMREEGFNVQYWKHPKYLPFAYYSDYAHMNDRGMDYYSKWLVEKIAHQFTAK